MGEKRFLNEISVLLIGTANILVSVSDTIFVSFALREQYLGQMKPCYIERKAVFYCWRIFRSNSLTSVCIPST